MSIQSDVDRGLTLCREIEQREDELKAIIARLETAAVHGEQVPLEDADREGKQYLANGSDMTVPVIITSDELVGSFADASPIHTAIETAADGNLKRFFKKTVKWERLAKDGKAFRTLALGVLGKEKAPPFISTCVARDKHGIPKNKIVVQWERARVHTGEPA
jgi:hypothetical protein